SGRVPRAPTFSRPPRDGGSGMRGRTGRRPPGASRARGRPRARPRRDGCPTPVPRLGAKPLCERARRRLGAGGRRARQQPRRRRRARSAALGGCPGRRPARPRCSWSDLSRRPPLCDRSVTARLPMAGAASDRIARSNDGGGNGMHVKHRAGLAALAIGVVLALSTAAAAATLEGRAILPAATFAPGPVSGTAIGGPVINGIPTPAATQPVQGFSATLPAEPGSYWVMPDNGYGAKANSADFLLRVYHVTPDFETAKGGPGTVSVGGFIQLRDPDGKIPFPLTRGDRLLTGADFDIESIRKTKDGTLWFGDEFGPFLLHTDAAGQVLEAPISLPGVFAPENPFRGATPPNLPSSGGP